MSNLKCLFIALAVLFSCAAHGVERAFVKVPVACMRVKPGHASEQSSQAIMGTPVEVLAKSGDWWNVRTPDGYTGYIRSNSLAAVSEKDYAAWKRADRVVCNALISRLYTAEGDPAGYVTMGSVLKGGYASADSTMLTVSAPDGRQLFAPSDNFYVGVQEWREACHNGNAQDVIEAAYTMLGDPYLWGGTSSLAPDCSGFTQIAYQAAGLLLPRDTSMQIKCGEEVNTLDEALPGDLIFYGNAAGRVNHVAIYLGEGKIIHSSGSVRICRMSASAPGNEELYTDKPLSIKRVLGVASPQTGYAAPGVISIFDSNIYF